MLGSNTSSVATPSSQPKKGQLRLKFGTRATPLVVSSTARAFRKAMPFDEQFMAAGPNHVATHSWIIIDPVRGILIRSNTYNGNLGERVDYLNPANCGTIPAEFVQNPTTGEVMKDANGAPVNTKEWKDKITKKGYAPIDLIEVPYLEVEATAPAAEEVKATAPAAEEVPANNAEPFRKAWTEEPAINAEPEVANEVAQD